MQNCCRCFAMVAHPLNLQGEKMKHKRLCFFIFGAMFGIALSAGVKLFCGYATQMRLFVSVVNRTPYEFKMDLSVDSRDLHFVVPGKGDKIQSSFKNEEHRIGYSFPMAAVLRLSCGEKKFNLRKTLNCLDGEEERILSVERDLRDGKLHGDVCACVSFIIKETDTGEIVVESMFREYG